ncbi:phage tail assembly protein [Salmonella enterica subsp. enterica serovar Newport]
MSDKLTEKTVKLDTPIMRGKAEITEIVLRKPQSGALRGTRLQAIMDMDVGAMMTVIPRISTPTLPVITITRKAGDGHRFTLADRGAYTGVIASWLHTREPRKKETTSVKRRRKKATTPKEPEAKQGDYLVGTDENVLVLNRTYANRSNAERAAKMQWERLQRGVASFSLQLAEGRADLYTEMPVKVTGFKQPIDDAEWTITTLTHSVSPDNGFTTSMELEVKIDGLEIE